MPRWILDVHAGRKIFTVSALIRIKPKPIIVLAEGFSSKYVMANVIEMIGENNVA